MTFKIFLIFLLIKNLTGENKFTFNNKNSSILFIDKNWDENAEAFHFRLATSGEKGNALTVYDKADERRLQINISSGKFNIFVEGQLYLVPGLTDAVIKIRRWYSIKLIQLTVALKIELNKQTVIIATRKRKVVSKWKSIHIGATIVEGDYQNDR